MPHLALEGNHYLEDAPVDRLRLLSDRILARVIKRSNKTESGLRVVWWEYETKTLLGRILLLGEDYVGPLQPGDYVIYRAWSGREFQSPDETLILLHPQDIEATVERNADK